MAQPSFMVALFGLFAMAAAAQAPGPSFDCALAASPAERMICADDRLRALDLGLSVFYASARRGRHAAQVQREQREWLSGERAACAAPDCLRQTMEERLWQVAHYAGREIPSYHNEDAEGDMLISDLGQGWYAFSATGLWFGPTVNDAEAYGAFHLDGESGELPGASSEECSYTLTRLTGDRWRIEEHPPESGIACGGMNATVEGTYNRSRR